MARNPKFTKEIKTKACQDYIIGNGSYKSIAKSIGANEETVRHWFFAYQKHGKGAFSHSHRNNKYPKKLKETIVKEYMSGQSSAIELGATYNISVSVLRGWFKKYYNGVDQTNYEPKGEVYTMKSRKTTFQERLKIVKWVVEHGMNYGKAAEKHGLRYSLVYNWVRKYQMNGADSLKHQKRGPKEKSGIDVSNMSETDRLKYELEHEKTLRKQAEFKLEVIKKKEEIEKNLRFQK